MSFPLAKLFVFSAALTACIAGVLTAGCGGSSVKIGSNTGGGSPAYVPARVPINWATRARAIGGPSSALSVEVTFDLADKNHANVTLEADRNATPANYRQTYVTSDSVQTGLESMHIRFYSQAGAQGSIVASADASVLVKSDGTITQANGSPINSVQITGNISSVRINGPQSVAIGTPQPIQVAAFDFSGDLIALSGGSVFYQITDGTGVATIDANGNLVGSAVGSITVTATVDNFASTPVEIAVTEPPVTVVAMPQAVNALIVNPQSAHVWASVPGSDPKYGNSVIEIDPATQKVVSTIPVGSNPTVLALSDDNNTLYVGLQGSDSFARVDLTGKAVVATYSITPTGFGGGQYASCIAVEPGNPNVVALCQQDNADSGFTGGCIYSNGVLLPNTMGVYNGYVLGFGNASTLWGSDPGFSPQSLFEGSVGASGANLTNTNEGLGGQFSVAAGALYFTNGQVVSGTTGSLLGTYALAQTAFGVGVTLDLGNQVTYILTSGGGGGQVYGISSYGMKSFTALGSYAIPNIASSLFGFTLIQPGRFVFADGTNLYFATLPGYTGPKAPRKAKT